MCVGIKHKSLFLLNNSGFSFTVICSIVLRALCCKPSGCGFKSDSCLCLLHVFQGICLWPYVQGVTSATWNPLYSFHCRNLVWAWQSCVCFRASYLASSRRNNLILLFMSSFVIASAMNSIVVKFIMCVCTCWFSQYTHTFSSKWFQLEIDLAIRIDDEKLIWTEEQLRMSRLSPYNFQNGC